MSTLMTKLSNIALIALAASPLIAVSLAHAEPAAIKVSDLNTQRPADMRVFDARVDHAANKVCVTAESRGLDRQAACRVAVREEAQDKLNKSQAEARAASPDAG